MTSCTVNDGKITVPVNEPQLGAGEKYKLMLWDNDQSPLINSITNESGFFTE